ncbi:MAG: hypothetical protein SNJ57_15885 [Cyanobacteriota bacterium]
MGGWGEHGQLAGRSPFFAKSQKPKLHSGNALESLSEALNSQLASLAVS